MTRSGALETVNSIDVGIKPTQYSVERGLDVLELAEEQNNLSKNRRQNTNTAMGPKLYIRLVQNIQVHSARISFHLPFEDNGIEETGKRLKTGSSLHSV